METVPTKAHTRATTLLALAGLVAASLVAVAASPAVAATTTCFGQEVTMEGTSGDDVIDLTGNPGQVVATHGGDDTVIGSSDTDVVCLGGGNDRFEGNGGNDKAYGGRGKDFLDGGSGNDDLDGGSGRDVLKGRSGDDVGEGRGGRDKLLGGRGVDRFSGGRGDDVVKGGKGNDLLNGGDVSTSIAQSGDDEVYGGRGYDRLWSNWGYNDGDADGSLHGGPDYDYCGNGAVHTGCERDHQYTVNTVDPTQNEWYPLVDEVFTRWGLDQESCAKHKNADGVKVRLCIPDQRANGVEILMCESGGWPFSQNGTSGTAGLFQNHPLYWQDRVNHLIHYYGAGSAKNIEPDFPSNADPYDPEWSVAMAAMLVYQARETILLRNPDATESDPGELDYRYLGGAWKDGSNVWHYYPEFNYDRYAAAYKPVGYHMTNGGYTNNGEGPEPWGQWVSCGAMQHVWSVGQNLYDPAWRSPWDPNPEPDWWPVPPGF